MTRPSTSSGLRWTERDLSDFMVRQAHHPERSRRVFRGRRAQKAADAAIFKISEDQWQTDVEQLAALFGWRFYHTRDSRKSQEGFPDLIMLRRGRMVVAELKVGDKAPTDDQQAWLDDFKKVPACREGNRTTVEVFVWYPEDIEKVKRVLR